MSDMSRYYQEKRPSAGELDNRLSDSIEELSVSRKRLLDTAAENTELKINYAVLLERRRWLSEIDRMTEDSNKNAREVARLLAIHIDGKVRDAIQNERQKWIRLLKTGRLGWLQRPPGRKHRRYQRPAE
jgi:hypothetical protein